MSKLFYFFFMLLFSFKVLGRTEQFQLKGSFKLDSSIDKAINYLLNWSEENGEIKGFYSDTYFTSQANVGGSTGKNGRIIEVELPQARRGIKSFNILISYDTAKLMKTIPVSIIARDNEGNPLTCSNVKADLSSRQMIAQKQQEECREGFGALAGFCGIYEGLIAEVVDRQNRCNLLFADSVKFELDANANLTLYLGPIDEIFNTPGHLIGRLPINPKNNRIDITSRSCKNLAGIDSNNKSCKRLNLAGQFTFSGNKHFKGTYTIFDEGTKNTCRYTLSMEN